MNFSLPNSIQILERTPAVLEILLKELTEEWTHKNEGENTWSAYDIVGHLIHGEKTDWIPRAQIILSKSGKTFEPFDRYAQFENSKGKTMNQLLDEFKGLRASSISTLKALEISEAQLSLKGNHPELGEVTLLNLLATWTVHDLNHIHQIARVMASQYKPEVGVWKQYLGVLR